LHFREKELFWQPEIITVISMKKIYLALLTIFSLSAAQSFAQDLPHWMTDEERQKLPEYNALRNENREMQTGFTTPPSSPVRTIGEWEELQGLTITWTSYTTMLREIVRFAKVETRVYIIVASTSEKNAAITTLANGGVDTVNVTFVITPWNSVWSRDYGLWSVYTNDVDSLLSVDWIYNRPRPKDDTAHYALATLLNTPLYKTTTAPWNLVNTGGNFMTDGFGTAFASKLVLNDNLLAAGFGVNHTEAEIDTIMRRMMGIKRYIKMNTLPYDGIHHIDMHMKLLDEETLLVGQYPNGVADGPQIEANLAYVLANFNSVYGTPYKVIRIPMPADGGQYPHNGGDYLTYTNSSFINKTIIVPTYGISSDAAALQTYRDALPGYTVVGINSSSSIPASGALHCITKEIGTANPLVISHRAIRDTCSNGNSYSVNAYLKHRSGIQWAAVYYRTDTLQPYQTVAMSYVSNDNWTANIPVQTAGSKVYYYIKGHANSGKEQVRPMPAPAGYWKFSVNCTVGIEENNASLHLEMQPAFPNPSKGITCIPVESNKAQRATLVLADLAGRTVVNIFDGILKQGDNNLFFDSWDISAGAYMLVLQTESGSISQRLMVR
jgi:agmatine deiminase